MSLPTPESILSDEDLASKIRATLAEFEFLVSEAESRGFSCWLDRDIVRIVRPFSVQIQKTIKL